ncbi:MAG: hypothetical protein HY314_01255 [Acidobacteria bacterium]|nr:hypothetical protein [Acidobacteriota bacterium]
MVQSHQRQLVDASDPTYTTEHPPLVNPTNGSWWILQVQPFGLDLELSPDCRPGVSVEGGSRCA